MTSREQPGAIGLLLDSLQTIHSQCSTLQTIAAGRPEWSNRVDLCVENFYIIGTSGGAVPVF